MRGRHWRLLVWTAAGLGLVLRLAAQSVISGRVQGPRSPGTAETLAYGGVYVFGCPTGTGIEARSFRSWETDPAGWYRLSGPAGNYTLLFTQPGGWFRPVVLNNVFVQPGEVLDGLRVAPAFDQFELRERQWDPRPATAYYQLFVAKGRSLTQVGFKLATDGVDGPGPGSQPLVVSVHRQGPGPPDTWEQVGPAVWVPEVDCGGPKSYTYAAGWNSGEVPLQPGQTYAVRLQAQTPGNSFQAWWHPTEDDAQRCYRVSASGAGWTNRSLWLAIGTDADGLVIPYNKRVHKAFGAFAGFARKWSQTYVAQGRSLAGVVLFAAVGGAQPPLARQRVLVRVRRDGPDGPVVGIEKIAVGNGNYTGDASWGVFGVTFAPGEVPLTPGQTYAVEFESLETYQTLHGFVNIKGQVSDDRPGFNPYRKHPAEADVPGQAFKLGREPQQFDLDMQIIEYESAATNWAETTVGPNRVHNGDFEAGPVGPHPTPAPQGWQPFSLEPGTAHQYEAEPAAIVPRANGTLAPAEGAASNRFVRLCRQGPGTQPGQAAAPHSPAGGGQSAPGLGQGIKVDGGWVQRVTGLERLQTYRLRARVRASWAADAEHQCYIGWDPTGQDTDPRAPTVVWSAALPGYHGHFVCYTSPPIRPATNAISIWLRARASGSDPPYAPFQADFDDVALEQVPTHPPQSP